jgi:WhiB family redox-sensing transcriptional regulator
VTPEELAQAACAKLGVDPELFFLTGREDTWPETQVAVAKAVCSRCPVAWECLLWANRTHQPSGIWGGMTPGERQMNRPRSLAGVS